MPSMHILYTPMVVFSVLLACIALIFFQWRRVARLKSISQKQWQELQVLRRKEALGTLAGGIAHDFNNILGSIMGFSALLEDDLISQPQLREMATHIKIAAKRGQGIVAQLLMHSKRIRQAENHEREVIAMDELMKESVALVRANIRSSTEITYENMAGDGRALVDATQIGQAILNLCINADHAIGVRTGSINIKLDNMHVASAMGTCHDGMEISGGEGSDESRVTILSGKLVPGDYLKVSVTDNGDGMTRDIAQKIFEPFFTTKSIDIGTGLGLSAIQGVIFSHGGAVTVETMRFSGSTFSLIIPANTSLQSHEAPQVEMASQ